MPLAITTPSITAEDALRFVFEKLHRMYAEEYQSVVLSMILPSSSSLVSSSVSVSSVSSSSVSLASVSAVSVRQQQDLENRQIREFCCSNQHSAFSQPASPQSQFVSCHPASPHTTRPAPPRPAPAQLVVTRHPREIPTTEMAQILQVFSIRYPAIASENNIPELLEVLERERVGRLGRLDKQKKRIEKIEKTVKGVKGVKEGREMVQEWRVRIGRKIRGVVRRLALVA